MTTKGSSRVELLTSTAAGDGITPCPQRILVVDDDSDIRRLSTEALASFGYHVDAAEDGVAGWEALNANTYDLLITDHNMPKLTGVNLIKKLHAARMTVPVILASGVISGGESGLLLAANLPKPFTLDQLLGTVQQVLRATQSAHEQMKQLPITQRQPPVDGLWL